MADYGLKVTRDGVSTSSSDLRDYVMHSAYKNLKTQEPTTTTTAAIKTVKTIAHGLGYAPQYFFYIEAYSGKWYDATVGSFFLPTGWASNYVSTYAGSDATNLYFQLWTQTVEAAATFNLKYYIVIDQK